MSRTPTEAREWAEGLLDGTTPGRWAHTAALSPTRPDDGDDIIAQVHSGLAADATLMAAAPDLAREVVRLATMLEEPTPKPLDAERDHADLDRLAVAYGRAVLAVETTPNGALAAVSMYAYIALITEARRLTGADHE